MSTTTKSGEWLDSLGPGERGDLGLPAGLEDAVDLHVHAHDGVRVVVPGLGDRAEADQPRLRLQRQPALLAGGDARSRRRSDAAGVDGAAADARHPQDGHADHAAADLPGARLGRPRAGHQHAVLGAADPGLPVRHRRRRVLRLHAEHVVLLPPADAGHGARPAGRHRQLRCLAGAAADPVDHRLLDGRLPRRVPGDGGRCPARSRAGGLVPERRVHLHPVHRHRRDPGLDDAQVGAGEGELQAAVRHLLQPGHLVDDADLHHDLRHLLRAVRAVRPADEEPLRRRQPRDRPGRRRDRHPARSTATRCPTR